MKLYNTLGRKIDEFIPIEPNKVKMYTCGPTVYSYAHIGNLRTYIHEDILVKALEYVGYDVNRVMNITDVGHLESDADDGEDKMLKGAQREHKSVLEIAKFYTDAFFSDTEKLNIKRPSLIGVATDYINDYIEFIKVLEQKGFTYFANGNVYFDISKKPDYTKLSGLDLTTLQTAVRDTVTEDKNKRNPQDFVLWFTKSKFENQALKWDSPWGVGYPGWHIECSVISLKNLGNKMDIHCGGVDHIQVHHTNEIAQTESYTGENWVNYWWHAEHLLDNTGKMSKSKGKVLTLSVLEEEGYNPLVYRYYVLNSHYRKQLTFSFESLKQAESGYNKLVNKINTIKSNVKDDILTDNINSYKERFRCCIEDDLNTANAITVLYDVIKAEDLSEYEKIYLIKDFDRVLSLDLDKQEETSQLDDEETKIIDELIEKRKQAKKNKDFKLADDIRDELLNKGIQIKDTREGTVWSKI